MVGRFGPLEDLDFLMACLNDFGVSISLSGSFSGVSQGREDLRPLRHDEKGNNVSQKR